MQVCYLDASDFVIWKLLHGYFVIWLDSGDLSSAVKLFKFFLGFDSTGIFQKIIIKKE